MLWMCIVAELLCPKYFLSENYFFSAEPTPPEPIDLSQYQVGSESYRLQQNMDYHNDEEEFEGEPSPYGHTL